MLKCILLSILLLCVMMVVVDPLLMESMRCNLEPLLLLSLFGLITRFIGKILLNSEEREEILG